MPYFVILDYYTGKDCIPSDMVRIVNISTSFISDFIVSENEYIYPIDFEETNPLGYYCIGTGVPVLESHRIIPHTQYFNILLKLKKFDLLQDSLFNYLCPSDISRNTKVSSLETYLYLSKKFKPIYELDLISALTGNAPEEVVTCICKNLQEGNLVSAVKNLDPSSFKKVMPLLTIFLTHSQIIELAIQIKDKPYFHCISGYLSNLDTSSLCTFIKGRYSSELFPELLSKTVDPDYKTILKELILSSTWKHIDIVKPHVEIDLEMLVLAFDDTSIFKKIYTYQDNVLEYAVYSCRPHIVSFLLDTGLVLTSELKNYISLLWSDKMKEVIYV